jgi:hypothetical protein
MIVPLVVGILCVVAGSLAAVAVHAAPRADPALSAPRRSAKRSAGIDPSGGSSTRGSNAASQRVWR